MRAVELARALADPDEVRRRVVRRARARVDARHRTLVVHQQALVARVELGVLERLEVGAARIHELDRAVDLARDRLVAGVRRVRREALVPRVHLAEVGEAALREGPDEVQRRGRRVVAAHESRRVGRARLGREVVAVHDVAAVGGQRDVAAGLGVARTGLRELSRHPAHLHDGHRGAVGEHDRHLQHGLHAIADLVGGRAREGLGAVAALQQERLAARGRGQSRRAACRPRRRRRAAAGSRAQRMPRARPRRRATAGCCLIGSVRQ